jgi:polyketide biosynthesis enoyl-CoA hydratase PksI
MATKIRINRSDDGIFELNLNDPENQNRLGDETCNELQVAFSELAAEPTVKVLVLTGCPDVFCAGASLDMLHTLAGGKSPEDLSIPMQMLSFPVPLIAALEGHAVGGGMALAICCDILIASENSRYGFNFTSMGFTPGLGTTSLLPEFVGTGFATEMLLTAKFYKGRDIKDRGLFNYVVPQREVRTLAWDLARSMADKPRQVLEMVKDTLTMPRRRALQQALSQERLMHKICFSGPEIWSMITGSYMDKS